MVRTTYPQETRDQRKPACKTILIRMAPSPCGSPLTTLVESESSPATPPRLPDASSSLSSLSSLPSVSFFETASDLTTPLITALSPSPASSFSEYPLFYEPESHPSVPSTVSINPRLGNDFLQVISNGSFIEFNQLIYLYKSSSNPSRIKTLTDTLEPRPARAGGKTHIPAHNEGCPQSRTK